MEHYQNQSCPEAAELIRADFITYSVLSKILQGECAHIFTDLKNLIVCHSGHPYPVWVWCRDVENEETVTEIARCIKEELPLEQGYVHIVSYELREKLQEMDAYFRDTKEKMGLLSYRLDAIEDIDYPSDGSMSLVREAEIDLLVGHWRNMHLEMEGLDLTLEHCRNTLQRFVDEKKLFSWRTDDGRIVALTSRGDQGKYSKITSVYTLPEYRRKGYAINLVHGVTETILADGLVPILYTDSAYAASNACYQKIGYHQVGRLIQICK